MRLNAQSLCCAVGLFSTVARAEEAKTDPSALPTPTANIMAHVNSRLFLVDTTTNGLPEFRFDVIELGSKGNIGIPTYEIKTRLNYLGLGLGIERANVGLTLPTETVVQLGRVSVFFDDDPIQAFETDGLRLWQPLTLGDLSLSLGAVLGNARVVENDILAKHDNDGYYYGFLGELSVMGAKVGAKYGAEPKRVASLPAGTTPGTMYTWGKTVAWLSYGMTGWNLGTSYLLETTGKLQTVKVENKKWSKDTDVPGSKATAYSEISLHGSVDSQLWGMTGMAQKGDKLIAGGTYVLKSSNYETATKDNLSEKFKANYFEMFAGYNAGNFNGKLWFVTESSKNKWYWNDKNTEGKSAKQSVYLEFDYSTF